MILTSSTSTSKITMSSSAFRRALPALLLVLFVLGLAALASLGDLVLQRRVILCLINITVVVGLYVFMGNSGVLNFSAVGFMAIGAYTAAILTMPPAMKGNFLPDLPSFLAQAEFPLLAGPFFAALVAGSVALIIGGPIMRLSGIAAGIATFSLMFIIYVVLGNWNALTGGQTSLMGLKGWVGMWSAAFFACGAILVAWTYQETRFALALRASREDEVAARASGLRVVRLRLGAFTLGAAICGAGGALYGHFQGTLRVENFYLDPTFLYVAMLVVGGQRSLTGAVVGTVLIAVLAEGLRLVEVFLTRPDGFSFAGLSEVVLAALMLFILSWRPQGLTGGREIDALWSRKIRS